MSNNESEQQVEDKLPHLLPAQIQVHNIFVVEIIARRFPIKLESNLSAQSNLQLEEIQVDTEQHQAQAILSVQVDFPDEPRPFEISFKLVGIFSYTQELASETVLQFLNQGSFSVLLPFARELLMSLCTRLQVPPLILQMVQLAL